MTAAVALERPDMDLSRASVKDMSKMKTLYGLTAQMALSTDQLNNLVMHFIHDMHTGLDYGEYSSFKMLPSFVYRGSTDVSGPFMALDLGGTNFRVMLMMVEKGKIKKSEMTKYAIPKEHMTGDANGLFGFIADKVGDFVEKHKLQKMKASLGFTFSFPVNQTALNQGRLIQWTKGFSADGVEGHDVVALLQEQLRKRSLNIDVLALCNDTVGTLVTGYFADQQAEMGVILGTGSNACYWEEVDNLKKLPKPDGWDGKSQICINMEWGNFDSGARNVLPYTPYDIAVDHYSPNPGKQLLEKMMSGMYLGELARLVLFHLMREKLIGTIPALIQPHTVSSAMLSEILSDGSSDLRRISALLEKEFKYTSKSIDERAAIQKACGLIAMRSAKLAAAAIAAVLMKTGRVRGAKVCIDGSVYEHVPGYHKVLVRTLDEIFSYHGMFNHGVRVVLTPGGSGVGAALIASLASKAKAKL